MDALRRYFRLRPGEQHLHPVGRLALFGDAVLAIAATLLVLTLSVPVTIGPDGLTHVFTSQRFTFVAVLIGFFEIGGSWLMTRRLGRLVEFVDHWLTLLWLAALFTATLIPFTTLVLARSFDRDDFGVGVLAVSVVTWLALMLSTAAVVYARRVGLMRDAASSIYAPYVRLLLLADLVWTVAVAISLVVPWLAFGVIVVGYAIGLSPLPTEGRDSPSEAAPVFDES
jgi:uncharacterized membrane protein